MFVINESQYSKIEPYLLLPDSVVKKTQWFEKDSLYASKKRKFPKKSKYNFDTIIIELNSADTANLKMLRGIGSYYARQIVYQREKLGGYHSVTQLYEIERMREETVLKIIPFLTVDTNLIKKIHINSDLAPDMVKHPYITWNMAIRIQDYRDFSHKFKSVRDLVKNGLLNEELYIKLAPYLEL
jgi:DNA uptake protein ComE-like DNA-binding protein